MDALPYDPAELGLTLFEQASDALFLLLGGSTQVVHANAAAEQLTGRSQAQLLSASPDELFRAEAAGASILDMLRQEATAPARGEFLLRGPGENAWIPVQVTLLRGLPARRPLSVLTARDMRPQHAVEERLRQKEAELRNVLASVSDCVWSADVDTAGEWSIRYCSPVIKQITGRPPEFFTTASQRAASVIHPEDLPRISMETVALLQRLEPGVIEHRILMPDGAIRWIRQSMQPSRAPRGSFRIDAVVSDITERKRIEDRLRDSERRYRDLVETSNDLIWSIDARGRWTYVNGKAARMIYGREPAEMIGHTLREFLAPEYVERELRTAQPIRKGQPVHRYETVQVRKDGTRVHLSFNAVSLWDEQGNLLGNTGTATDITQWKEAEAALVESQQRFETFMNRIPMVGFIKDADGRLIYVNQGFVDTFDRPAEYFLGKLDHELWPADVAAKLRETDLRVLAGTQPIELRELVPTAEGRLREWWAAKFPFRDAAGRVFLGGIALDLTERQQLEQALLRSEERYRQLWQRNLAGGFRAALDGRILDCNDSFARLFGFATREEMLTHSTTELYFDLGVRAEFIARLREHQTLSNYEMGMRRADGTPVWVLENVSLLVEEGQEILEGTIIDISERKRTEEALRASETNYRTLIDNLDQGIFLKDRELRYVTVNAIFCHAVQRTEEQLRGKRIDEVFPKTAPSERSRALEMRVLKEGRSIETEEELKLAGKRRIVRVSRTPVRDAGGGIVGVLGICWDVTEHRALESQLRHVQKMDAIGQLAGGVAHDFNNLLTIMLGNLSYARAGNTDLSTTLELVKNAENAGLRAAELTQTLLGFSRRAALATIPFSLNVAIEEVVRLTRSTLPPNIELEVKPHAHPWLVQVDPTHMNQVLTNLTLNARDAMPSGGKITYQLSHFVPDAVYLARHVEARPGEFVRLRVSDTGHGVSAELRERIFEPFFTTKDKDKGTGLGLAIVFSIVKQHHGWVVCDSGAGGGTTFDIFLPRCEVAAAVAPVTTMQPASGPKQETILLVDDEAMIRQLASTILTKAGYDVLHADNGEKALEVYRTHQDRIALVVLDSVMPRLSGRETLRELVKLAPNVTVLFSSGYSTEQLALNEFPQVRGFLSKPYRAEQLIQKVVELLGEFRRAATP